MRTKAALVFLLLGLWARSGTAKDTWLEARSTHFTLVTDAGKGRAEDVLEDLEKLRRVMTELSPNQPLEGNVPASIFLFKNDKSFRDFQPLRDDGKPEEWAAIVRRTSFESFIAMAAVRNRDRLRELAYDQYLSLILGYGDFRYPLWLANGLSLFYANAHITDEHAELGKMHRGHREALGQFRSMPLADLFAVAYGSATYREPGPRALFDAQCWALMHYLLLGRPEGAAQLARFVDLLADGHEQTAAFEQATEGTLEQTDAAVALYIRKSIYQYARVPLSESDEDEPFRFVELSDAAADAALGKLLIATGRHEEARARLDRALASDPTLVEAYEGLGFLGYVEGGESEKTLSALERAVERKSSNPMVHLLYARTLLADYRGTVAEIPQPVRRAALGSLDEVLRVSPDHVDAAQLYGFLCLFDEADLERGSEVVRAALETHRGHTELLFIMGQLHAKRGDYEAARAIYENLLQRSLDASFAERVRRQLEFVRSRSSASPDPR